jgi:hemerythrin-like domain-containing protein
VTPSTGLSNRKGGVTMLCTEILLKEHKVINRFLQVLEEALRKQKEGKALPPGFPERALDVLETFVVRLHLGKEESILVTGLEERGFAKSRGPLAEMLAEHERIRQAQKSLPEALKKAGEGDAEAKGAALDIAGELKALYAEHARKEETQIFSFADETYTDIEHEDTVRAFISHSNAIGEGLHQKYKKTVEEMAAAVQAL